MRHHFKLLAFHVFLAATLVACGGGGGSSSNVTASNGSESSPVPDNLSDIAWAVDAAAARQAVAGSEALAITLAQATQEITAIENNLDATSASDALVYQGTGSLIRVPATCSGLNCTFTLPDGTSETVNFGEPSQATGTTEGQLIMAHNGVSLGQSRHREGKGTADQFELLVYGGWLTHSAFEIGVAAFPSFTRSEVSFALTLSYGDDAGTNPSENSGMTATWTGVMAGVDMSAANRENFIHGEATATVDFANSDMDLTFSNLVDLNDANRNSALNGMNWTWQDLSLTDGAFQSGSSTNQIQGQFYGPNHEEVGGTFERNRVIGAFGAARQSQ